MAHFRNTLFATTALVPLGVVVAVANPLASQVVGGSANVQGQGTSTVTVTQSTDKAIINWQTFNIGSGESTRFIQPNSSSITLNRVTGGLGASSLDGTLIANGRVFLVNPDGILFSAGSKVNTGGFLATTNDIRNSDFMAGRYQFNIPGRPDASIVNLGTITAQNGGFAALVAPGVRNSGTITANLGTVGLVAGNNFSLDFYGDRLITLGVHDSVAAKVIDVATGQPLNALVKNEGKLKANGGRVELTAASARRVVDAVINNTGVVEANSIGKRNGMIVLSAATSGTKLAGTPTQTVKVSGRLLATGKRKDTNGGTVVVTGENVQLTSAIIDVSGRAGGGTVLIGGDVGGGKLNPAVAANPKAAIESFSVASASTVSVDAGTTINATAKTSGDGGKVVVWSDQATAFYGSINTQGGSQSGSGGFVEISSHEKLDFNGAVDLAGKNGNGTLLFDPQNVTISSGANSNGSLSNGTFTPNGASSVLNVTALQNALNNGNVLVTTGFSGSQAGNITVASPVTWFSQTTLSLNAANNIAINAAINGTNGGLTLSAGTAGLITAPAAVSVRTFTLQSGSWSQVTSNLSTFFARDFRIAGGSYLRALGGNGSIGSPYTVTDVYGLQGIGSSSTLLGSNWALANDINASGTVNWNGGAGFIPIGASPSTLFFLQKSFTGAFDGKNHSINNLTIASSNFDVGLLAAIGSSGAVRNVSLANANISGVGRSDVSRHVGLLAGTSNGTITDASITNSKVVIPSGEAGGLVGVNAGTIDRSDASVTVIANDTALVGGVTLGGLVGSNFGTITQSTTSGSVSTVGNSLAGGLVGFNLGVIRQSSATGPVHGGSFERNGNTFGSTAGGLVGQNSGSVSDSYATGQISGGWAGGLVGANFSVDGAPAPGILRSYATGAVSVGNDGTAGGLAGINAGTVTQTFATGSVTGGSNSVIGGLVGLNSILFSNSGSPLTISQSYAVGSVTGGINSHVGGLVADNTGGLISETYAVGPVNGAGNSVVGGLVAVNSSGFNFRSQGTSAGIVRNSYWDIFGTGQTSSAGGTAMTVAQLTAGLPNGFSGSVWTINSGSSYAYLRWQSGNIPRPTPAALAAEATAKAAADAAAALVTLNAQLTNQSAQAASQLANTSVSCEWACTIGGYIAPVFEWISGSPNPNEATVTPATSPSTAKDPSVMASTIQIMLTSLIPGPAGSVYNKADDVAEITVTITKFLQTVSVRNKALMDDWIQGSCPGQTCSVAAIKEAGNTLSNLPLMGVNSFKDVVALLGMSNSSYQQQYIAFVTLAVAAEAVQLGKTIK